MEIDESDVWEYAKLAFSHKTVHLHSTAAFLRPLHPIIYTSPHLHLPCFLSHFPSISHLHNQPTNRETMASLGALLSSLPPSLDSSSQPPKLFDGTTRLYISYTCPFAQRVWITRNYKNLEEKIEIVPINLQNRPSWYKEKIYPENKVPSLEHNGKIIGESLDLIKYVESNFEGPALIPSDPSKKEFLEELLSYTNTFVGGIFGSFKGEDAVNSSAPHLDYLENALTKFTDGPFFLGDFFSLADIAYIPFIERFKPVFQEVLNYDLTTGRPKLTVWIEEVGKVEGYKKTRVTDPKEVVELYKSRFLVLFLYFTLITDYILLFYYLFFMIL